MKKKTAYIIITALSVIVGTVALVAEILTKTDFWVYIFLASVAMLCIGFYIGLSAYSKHPPQEEQ